MKKISSAIIAASLLFLSVSASAEEKTYIKWIDFNVTAEAMEYAAKADISTCEEENHCQFITLLSLLGAKYGGDFKSYKESDAENIKEMLCSGKKPEDITQNLKLYNYYTEAYGAVLGGFINKTRDFSYDEQSLITTETSKYGIAVYSPIAAGYYYNHYDDFGASRSYGYKRKHLGHDLMGNVGTPIIAIESGYVEACGWNQYGGWRIGIRSFDGKRYYYYAHLRKDKPYEDMYEGKTVAAGELIGYLGMTGYSSRENVNNIDTPHLHYGMQIIFDSSQKDGYNQIWIDMYEITKFLSSYKASICKNKDGQNISKSYSMPENFPD